MYILDFLGNIFTVDLSTGLANFVAETVINGEGGREKSEYSMDIVFDANFTLYAQGTHPDRHGDFSQSMQALEQQHL